MTGREGWGGGEGAGAGGHAKEKNIADLDHFYLIITVRRAQGVARSVAINIVVVTDGRKAQRASIQSSSKQGRKIPNAIDEMQTART